MKKIQYAMMALGAIITSCSSASSDANGADSTTVDERPMVQVQQVYAAEVDQMATYTATVEAFKTNNISSSTPNRIKSILVDVGSTVHAGQKVAILDDVNISQLKVRLDNAEREYRRAVQLLEIGSGTQQAVDQVKTELDAQRRQYDNMVENTILTSPISGVVTARNYDPGDMTGALPILTVEQIQPVKVIVHISEGDFAKVRRDEHVDIALDTYPDENFTGTVYLIHPVIDTQTRTFTVEVTIDNPSGRILPGMFARVRFNFGHERHVVVPDRAIVKMSGSGNRYVYVYNPQTHTVSYNLVTLGQRLDDTYELLSGVDDGALVVTSGQSRLADGIEVNVIKQD